MTRTVAKTGCVLVLVAAAAWAQDSAKPDPAVESVLVQMDKAAAAFRTAEASFVWDQYQKVVNDTDTQSGKIYFRRQGKEVQMAADITTPRKYVLYGEGKAQIYEPNIDQVTVYNVTKNRADVESLLVLGFGGSGHDLLKDYVVTSAGTENVAGVNANKLQLVPKSVKLRNNIERIVLWIDPARGISVQQQFFQGGGDYRLAKYSNIQINQKINDNVFKLKTTPRTKTLSPSGE
jgi:outer membrane lipoprotein-sorting protein